MADFTIEELQALLALRKPNIEDFQENGAYDERAYEYQNGMYVNRQEYGKQLLKALQTIETLTAENRALQARIDAALAIPEMTADVNFPFAVERAKGYSMALEDVRETLVGRGEPY